MSRFPTSNHWILEAGKAPAFPDIPMRRLACLLLLQTLAGGGLWANGNRSVASAGTRVTIRRPIILAKCQNLWFGALIVEPGNSGRKVIQNAADGGGTRQPDPAGVIQIAQGYDRWHNAEFEISGEPNASFSVDMPKHGIQLPNTTASGPGLTLYLDVPKFNYYTDNAIGPDGKTKMWIGGRLDLPENPTPGYYRADIQVTVAYN